MAARKWTNEQLTDAVKKNKSVAGVIKHLGVSEGSRSSVVQQIELLKLDIKHFRRKTPAFNKNGELNAAWKKFKKRLNQFHETSLGEWTPEHFLGHILYRYKQHCYKYEVLELLIEVLWLKPSYQFPGVCHTSPLSSKEVVRSRR